MAKKTQHTAGTSTSVRNSKSGSGAKKSMSGVKIASPAAGRSKSGSSSGKKIAVKPRLPFRTETPLPPEDVQENENTQRIVSVEPLNGRKNSSPVSEKCDTFKLYMKDTASFDLLNPEDEIILSHQIHYGNETDSAAARERLISSNLRLVVKIAHDFKGKGLELQDLISEGNVGLMRAAEKFDPSKGAKFSSYAAWWIKQSMRRAISNQRSVIRIPVQSGCKMAVLRKTMHYYIAEHGMTPSAETLADLTCLSLRTVRTLLLADRKIVSLQDQIREGEDGSIMELVEDVFSPAPDRECLEKEDLLRMQEMLQLLTDREREIIQLRFGLCSDRAWTLEEVSKKVNRTRERVRQLQNQALEKMRSFLTQENVSCA